MSKRAYKLNKRLQRAVPSYAVEFPFRGGSSSSSFSSYRRSVPGRRPPSWKTPSRYAPAPKVSTRPPPPFYGSSPGLRGSAPSMIGGGGGGGGDHQQRFFGSSSANIKNDVVVPRSVGAVPRLRGSLTPPRIRYDPGHLNSYVRSRMPQTHRIKRAWREPLPPRVKSVIPGGMGKIRNWAGESVKRVFSPENLQWARNEIYSNRKAITNALYRHGQFMYRRYNGDLPMTIEDLRAPGIEL